MFVIFLGHCVGVEFVCFVGLDGVDWFAFGGTDQYDVVEWCGYW